MPEKHIPLIMEIIDNIVLPDDRKRKYTDRHLDWKITKGNTHDSRVSHDMVDSVRNFSYILGDSAYDTSDTYDYVFENTHALLHTGGDPPVREYLVHKEQGL